MCRKKSSLFPFSVLMILILSGCAPHYRPPATAPDSAQGHASLVMRFSAESGKERQRGKVVVDVDEGNSRLLFLNPLNRVVMEMRISGERTLLINRRDRSYWEGEFRHLLWRLWRLRLDFNSLRALLFSSTPPCGELGKAGFQIRVERNEDTGKSTRLEITGPSARLTLKVLRRRRAAGHLEAENRVDGMRLLDLEGVISRGE